MEKELTSGEIIKALAEENQTRLILEIIKECENLPEAEQKIKALLEK